MCPFLCFSLEILKRKVYKHINRIELERRTPTHIKLIKIVEGKTKRILNSIEIFPRALQPVTHNGPGILIFRVLLAQQRTLVCLFVRLSYKIGYAMLYMLLPGYKERTRESKWMYIMGNADRQRDRINIQTTYEMR